jgi:hypothetical protein
VLINNLNGAVLEKLVDPQIVKRFPSYYGTQRITTTNCPSTETGGPDPPIS